MERNMKIQSEETEQKKLVQYLRAKNIFHFAPLNENNQSFMNRNTAIRIEAKAKAMGKMNGVSDIIVMLKGSILFIELKRAKKRLRNGKLSTSNTKVSEAQKSFISTINDNFGNYAYAKVCYGADEAISVIEDINKR